MAKTKGLKILIVGCGKVGQALVEQLSKEGHDITVIDKNSEKVRDLTDTYDVMGIVGNGASYSVLREADVSQADLIIAVTNSDELNLLCCTVARRVGDCAAIARVRTPDYSREVGYLREKLGLAMIINPELEAAKEMARLIYLPTALEMNSFAHGQAELVKFKIPPKSMLCGKTIMQIGDELPVNVLFCGVERGKEVYIPNGGFRLEEGDTVSVVATRSIAKQFLEEVGFETTRVRNAMIVGGGKAAYYLARQLGIMGISVKIIEQNRARCEELTELLPKAVIINADGTSEGILREEGIEYIDAFIPLTGIDEENVMLTLFARQVSRAKVITKINRNTFKEVYAGLDLGSVVYPRYITAEAIIAYVRAKKNSMNSNVETLYHMFDGRVEAIEFRVNERSAVTGIPLKKLHLKKELLISFICRDGAILFPSGQDTIEVGDSVMLVTKHSGFNDIQDILA